MNWKLYSFVVRSEQRRKIILSLEKPKTPTQIAQEIKASVSHVSRALSQFAEKEIVECLTPKEKVGRVYTLTKAGKEILKHLKR
jgi:predicted transcriptional regulator